jgi:hypothetical protein
MKNAVKNRKRLLAISVALFMICGMALGYATLSSSIKINGTGTISTNWDILFTNIEEKSSKRAVNNDSRITDKLTATFDVDLDSPGSYIEYNVTLKNNGNTDAVIAKVTGIVEANNAAPTGIQFKVSGIRIGDDLFAGSETTFVVRAEIPGGEVTLPSGSKTLDLKVEVRQKEVDSSGLVTTLSECFETNEIGDTITGYLCGKGNTNGYSEILDINIPREINGHIITKIGRASFSSKGLKTVNISNTVTVIESQAFYGNLLKQLHLPTSIKTIEGDAFARNQLSEIEIPLSVTKLGNSAFTNNNMSIDQAFIYNRNSDGTEDKSSLNSYAGSERTKVVIPDSIKEIKDGAFYGCGITEVELPDQLVKVGGFGFSGNLLSSIIFPSSLKSLSNYAFGSNPLNHIEFQGEVPVVGGAVFVYKGANTIKVPAGTLEQYKNVSSQSWFGSDNESLLDAFYE